MYIHCGSWAVVFAISSAPISCCLVFLQLNAKCQWCRSHFGHILRAVLLLYAAARSLRHSPHLQPLCPLGTLLVAPLTCTTPERTELRLRIAESHHVHIIPPPVRFIAGAWLACFGVGATAGCQLIDMPCYVIHLRGAHQQVFATLMQLSQLCLVFPLFEDRMATVRLTRRAFIKCVYPCCGARA